MLLAPILVAVLIVPLGLDLYMPVPEANPMTAEKIELGRVAQRPPPLARWVDGVCHPDEGWGLSQGRSPTSSGRWCPSLN